MCVVCLRVCLCVCIIPEVLKQERVGCMRVCGCEFYILVRMAIIKKSANNKFWRVCGKKGNLSHCWWECKLVQPLWRTVWRFLKKLEIDMPYDPAIPLLGIHTEKTRRERDTSTPMFIAALFITVALEGTVCSYIVLILIIFFRIYLLPYRNRLYTFILLKAQNLKIWNYQTCGFFLF